MNKNVWDNEDLIKILLGGGVAVMPTDTIYGMVGKALDSRVVNHIYEIRSRAPEKPCIILISDIADIEKFGIKLTGDQKNIFEKYQEPTSLVLDCDNPAFEYLHRGTKTLAFRLPNKQELRELLSKTGPLIAPSANIEKFPQSESIEDARKYFGDNVDAYVDAGSVVSRASKIIRLHPDGSVAILRE